MKTQPISEQDKFKKALGKFYLRHHPNQEDAAEHFVHYIMDVLEKINKKSSKKPLTIITLSYNLKDGIDDFVNQADVTSWLHEIFSLYKHIHIKGLSILEAEKFTVAQRLMPANVKNSGVTTINDVKELEQNPEQKNNILLSYEAAAPALKTQTLQQFMKEGQYVINMARYIHFHQELRDLLAYCHPTALVHSRGEYGPLPNTPYDDEVEIDEKIYYETCMGAEEGTTGLKFYPSISNLCLHHSTDKDKGILLERLENQTLKKTVLGEYSGEEYIQNHGIALGYIQDKPYSIIFARVMIAKTREKKCGVTMMVNLSHFDNLEAHQEFMRQLQNAGFSEVRMIANNGTETQKLVLKDAPGKVLTLIEFKGTSQADKEKIIAMSDIVAGSGNSSFSEMLSSRHFPFIQPIYHVYMFYRSFIEAIPAEIRYKELLQHYLTLNITPHIEESDVQHLLEIVASAEQMSKIQQAWSEYCNFLETHRNAYDEFAEFACAIIIMNMLEVYGVQAYNQLRNFLDPKVPLAGTTLLHMAVEKGLIEVAKEIIVTQPELINASSIHRNYTPLMVAARYKHYDLMELMISSGAQLHQTDTSGLTIMHQVVITGDLHAFILLCQQIITSPENEGERKAQDFATIYHKELSVLLCQKDKNGKTPLDYLKPENTLAFTHILSGKDKEQLNYVDVAQTAIQYDSEYLFQMTILLATQKERINLLRSIDPHNKKTPRYIAVYLFALKEPIPLPMLYDILPPFLGTLFPEAEFKKLKLKDSREGAEAQLGLIHLGLLYQRLLQLKNVAFLSELIDPNSSHLVVSKNPQAKEMLWKLSWTAYEKIVQEQSKGLNEKQLQKLVRDLLLSKIFFYLQQYLANYQKQAVSGIFQYLPNSRSSKHNLEQKISEEKAKIDQIKLLLKKMDSSTAIQQCLKHEGPHYLSEPLYNYLLQKLGKELEVTPPQKAPPFG